MPIPDSNYRGAQLQPVHLETLPNSIRCDTEKGVPKWHKPLLLLWALGRAAAGKQRLVGFADVEPELNTLFKKYGVSMKPVYPWWRLENDILGGPPGNRFWEADKPEGILHRLPDKEPTLDETRRLNVRAGFTSAADGYLRDDLDLLNRIAWGLLTKFFPSNLHSELRVSVGLTGNEVTQTSPRLGLRLAKTSAEVQSSAREFSSKASAYPDRAFRLLRQTTYWVYDPDEDRFAPAKFVGFAGMTFETYERAMSEENNGDKFDGHLTKNAIEHAIGQKFNSNSALSEKFSKWAANNFGPRALDDVDASKWQFTTLKPQRNYWAFLANPNEYRIEDAVRDLDEDVWIVKQSKVRAGDRVAIWKAKGRDLHRGVLALGEILTDPEWIEGSPEQKEYWRSTPKVGPQRRVRVRNVRPPQAPQWLEADQSGLLGDLSVSRATGGSVFRIEPDQWNRLIALLGGWPTDGGTPQAGGRDEGLISQESHQPIGGGQGFNASPEARRAVELYAEELAKRHFENEGYCVEKYGKPYDLRCSRGAEVLYVEVKGTTTLGEGVLLTRNEVEFARKHSECMVLFVVREIVVTSKESGPEASAGVAKIWRQWNPDDCHLTPVSFSYALPKGGTDIP